jgi:hypothetical protein
MVECKPCSKQNLEDLRAVFNVRRFFGVAERRRYEKSGDKLSPLFSLIIRGKN